MSGQVVYKWLNGREATHVLGFRYRLGRWKPAVKGELAPCRNGYHLVAEHQLFRWVARDLFVAEYEGEIVDAGDKMVVRRCRIVEHLKGWNGRTARSCAADFAERVLPIFEAKYPGDDRPRLAIQAARDYANWLIDDAAMAAAWAAAGDAARDAARDAAWAAAWAAAGAAAWAAAGAAAGDAAWAAAWAAAGDAAWAAAGAAAGDAARDAAMAAAMAAAWAAAGDAARDAAWAAAWDAARDAEHAWQGARILDYAYGRLS